MKIFKLITINFLVFAVLIGAVELFFRVNMAAQFLPEPTRPDFKYYIPPDTDITESLADLGESILDPLPQEFLYTPDSRIRDLVNSKYPIKKSIVLDSFSNFDNRRNQNISARATVSDDNIPLYDVHYKYNDYSRRETNFQNNKRHAKNAFLAFGCSMTFGVGVEQGKDYPSLLASKLNKDWKVYNFGIPGGGPNDQFDYLNAYPHFIEGINEKEGVFSWLFIQDHMYRFLCPWNCYHPYYSWILNSKSEYEMVDGKFQSSSMFLDSPKLKRRLYQSLSKSAIVQRYGYGFENHFTQEEYDLFVQSLDQMMSYFPNIKFKKKYVVIYGAFPELPLLINSLNKFGFEAVNYYKLLKVMSVPYATIPIDNHPTSVSTWYLSEIVKNRIEKDFGKK